MTRVGAGVRWGVRGAVRTGSVTGGTDRLGDRDDRRDHGLLDGHDGDLDRHLDGDVDRHLERGRGLDLRSLGGRAQRERDDVDAQRPASDGGCLGEERGREWRRGARLGPAAAGLRSDPAPDVRLVGDLLRGMAGDTLSGRLGGRRAARAGAGVTHVEAPGGYGGRRSASLDSNG